VNKVFALSLGRGFSALSQAFLVVVIAGSMNRSDSSYVLGLFAVSVTVAAVVDSGIGTSMLVARNEGSAKQSAELFTLVSLALLAVSVIWMLFFAILQKDVGSGTFLFATLIGPWAALERVVENGNLIDLAEGKAMRVSLQLALRRAVALVLALCLSPIMGPANSMITGLIAGSFLAFLSSSRPDITRINRSQLKTLLSKALPYSLSSWAAQVRNLDISVAGALAGFDAAYSLGLRVAGPVSIPFNSVGNLIMSGRGQSARRWTSFAVKLSLSASILLSILAFYLSEFLARELQPLIAWITQTDVWIVLLVMCRVLWAGCCSLQASSLNILGYGLWVSKISTVLTAVSLVGVLIGSIIWSSVWPLAAWPLVIFITQACLMQNKVRSLDWNTNA